MTAGSVLKWGADKPISGCDTPDTPNEDGFFMNSGVFWPLDEMCEESPIVLPLFDGENVPEGNVKIKARCQYAFSKGEAPNIVFGPYSGFSDWWKDEKEFHSVEKINFIPTLEHSYCFADYDDRCLSVNPPDSVRDVFHAAEEKGYNAGILFEYGADSPIIGNSYWADEDGFYTNTWTCPLDSESPYPFAMPLFSRNNTPEGKVRIKVRCKYVFTTMQEGAYGLAPVILGSGDWTGWVEDTHTFARSDVPVPSIDKTYGYDGIKYIYAGDKLSISFRVPKSDYANIKLEDDEILKVLFSYGAKTPNLKEDINPITEGEFEGYYRGWNAETVKQGNELRTAPVTGGVEGDEIHDLSDDYITVTVPLFGHVGGDHPIDLPYDGYKDGIYLGLEYVIMDKADCPDQDYETIDWNKAFEGEYSAKLYKNPTTIVSLRYDADEVDAGIYEGDNKVEPYSVTEPSGDIPNTEYYALDKTVSYNFKTETKDTGYKINKVAYTAGKTKANWATSKSFSPVDGALIAVNSQAIYAAVLTKEGETEALSPDAKGVYSASFMDTINFKIKKGNTTITPAKIVTKVGKKVIETLDNGESSPKFYDFGAYYGQKVTIELYEEGIANAVTTCSVQVTAPISSVTLKNKNVLIPAIDGGVVTSVVTVNNGANVNNLGFKFEGTDAATGDPAYVDSVDYLDVTLENGVLTIAPKEKCEVGRCVDIVFYDKENTKTDCDNQVIKDKKYTITAKAPAWANKTPNASLVSANDYQLEFKVTAPSGVKFDGKYWAAVKLSSNKNTAKGIKEGLDVNDNVKYVKINPDGTISQVLLNAFKYKEEYGSGEVTTLGEGCGTSVTADVYIVRTLNGAEPEADESNILASTKHRTLTVSTKKPYYADKITLKKTAAASKLYAGEWDPTTEDYKHVLVATIDFGKSATYTRAEDWEIANINELSDQGITVEKSGSNGIAVTTTIQKTVKAGTYTIKVQTVPPAGGVPVTASVNITVLPTPSGYDFDGIAAHEIGAGITVYRKPGTAVSYKINPVIYSQDGAVLKNVSINYELKKKKVDSSNPGEYIYEPVEGLSISKGTLKISKDFTKEENCDYVFSFNDGRFFDTGYFNINIIEDNISPASFGFANAGGQEVFPDKTEMTLLEYSNLGWSEGISFESLPAQFGIEEMWAEDLPRAGFLLLDSSNNVVSEDLIKSISIPNPAYIKKTGNITLSATTIDGTKLTKNIKIVADGAQVYNRLCIESGAVESESALLESGDACTAIAGTRTTAEYLIYLANSSGTSVNTKNNISGDTLSVKGAKIIENKHGDFLKIVMTQKVATITRKHGKEKTTYTLQNDSFDLPVLKAKARKGDVVYSGVCDNSQEMRFDLTGDYTEANYVRVYSSNSAFNSYIVSGNFNVNENTVTLSIDPEASQNLKPGSYPFTMELYDDDGNVLCKPTSLSLKVSKLKKSFKFTNKYVMSMTDMPSVDLSVTESGVYYYTPYVLYNANVKGSYDNSNNILNYLEFEGDDEIGTLKIKNGADLTGIKSLTGYVGYHIIYLDGTSEDRLEKVTVNIKNQIGKYSVTLNKKNNSPSGEIVEIKDAKGNVCDVTAIKLIDSKKNSPYIEEIVVCGDDEPGLEGEIVVNCSDPADPSARLKKGTYKATAIAILENSAYVPQEDAENPGTYLPPTEEDFAKYGVEVTITVKVPSGTIYI